MSVDRPGVEPASFRRKDTGRHARAVSSRWTISPFVFQWTAWESNPSHRPCKGQAAALQAVRLANAQPTRVVRVARVGVEPTDVHEGLSFAALPVCVPRHLVQASPMGFEPGHRSGMDARIGPPAGQAGEHSAAPRGRICVAQVGFEPTASLELTSDSSRHLFSKQAAHPAG